MKLMLNQRFNKVLCHSIALIAAFGFLTINKLEAADKVAETSLSPKAVENFLKEVMCLPPNDRVVLIANTDFEKSNEIVINFLNAGRKGVIALKGIPGVFNEFFFDSHPKAVGVSRDDLDAVGIDMPEHGVLDPWESEDKSELKEKILALREHLNLPVKAIERLEKEKFRTLGDAKMVTISKEPLIFNEGKIAYANFHILDLQIKDELGNYSVRTYQNSPVIAKNVTIMGVGPETLKVWGKIIKEAKAVIILGNPKGFEQILENRGQKKLFIAEKDKAAFAKLSDKKTWDAALQ